MDRIRIYIASKLDQDAVVLALTRNGYSVRNGKEAKTKTTFKQYVEFWKEGENARIEKDGDST